MSVPVLSAQITFVHPKTSTEGKFFTMAFFFAIFCVPRARQVVITIGRPSGIAATARATAIYLSLALDRRRRCSDEP